MINAQHIKTCRYCNATTNDPLMWPKLCNGGEHLWRVATDEEVIRYTFARYGRQWRHIVARAGPRFKLQIPGPPLNAAIMSPFASPWARMTTALIFTHEPRYKTERWDDGVIRYFSRITCEGVTVYEGFFE